MPDLSFGRDAHLGNLALVFDPGSFNGFARKKRRLFGVLFPLGTFPRQFCPLLRSPEFNLPLLVKTGFFGLAFDVQRLLLSLQIARANLDHRVLLDVVAQLATFLDGLDDGGQAFCIELVGRVEILNVGLVDVRRRDAFQFQAVLVEPFLRHFLDAGDVLVAILMHLLKRHLRRDGAQRRYELARQERMDALGFQCPPAEG